VIAASPKVGVNTIYRRGPKEAGRRPRGDWPLQFAEIWPQGGVGILRDLCIASV